MSPVSLRTYRRLLRLYPAAFRERHGAELESFFAEDLAQARRAGGAFWRQRFWLRTVRDAAGAALRLHADPRWRPSNDPRGDGMLVRLFDDFRHAFRMLGRHLRFTIGAVAVLAVGIGATVAAFSIVDHVLLRPLPYPHAERLMQVGMRFRPDPDGVGPVSDPDYAAIREEVTGLDAFAAASGGSVVLTGSDGAWSLDAGRATQGYFDLFGSRPAAGRLFAPADHVPGAPRVVVLSHGAWLERFGGDSRVVGRSITLDGEPHEVVGILTASASLPRGFIGEEARIWTPLQFGAGPLPLRGFTLRGVGRLKAGVSREQLAAQVQQLVERRYPSGRRPGFILGGAVAPLKDRVLGQSGRPILLAQAGVALLLLITCVNVAGLLLARGVDRQGEVAVRAALGAHPGRVLTQLLSESLVLALAGGAAGVGVAYAAVSAFKTLSPGNLPRLDEVALDARVLAAALGCSVLTGVLFGLVPAVQASRLRTLDALRRGGRSGTSDRHRSRLRAALIVGEVSLAVVLALASGLVANSYVRLTRVDTGFAPDGLISMRIELSREDVRAQMVRPRFGALLERVRALPGVSGASMTSVVPFTTDGMLGQYVPEGLSPNEDATWIPFAIVSAGYFPTMGVSMIEGRPLDATDQPNSAPVAVVNQAFVRTYWPDASSALGRTVKSGTRESDDPSYTVVGVSTDMRYERGRAAAPRIFLSFESEPRPDMNIVARAGDDPGSLAGVLRGVVREVDPALPITRLATMTDLAAATLLGPRFTALLIGSFGAIAVALALVGVYGTTAYATRGRTREIGIRMVLGAERRQVVRQIVARAVSASLLGVAVGIGVGSGATRLLTTFLFEVEPTDPATFVVVAFLVAAAAAAAAWIPARRAATVDPGLVLRAEG